MNDFRILEREALGALSSTFRRQLLEELNAQPDSAANIARRHNLSRQRVGYHMRELEKSGYIEVAEERQQRGLKERLYRVRSFAYVHSAGSAPPDVTPDRYSWATLLNLLARGLWDLVNLRRRADAVDRRLATLGMEAEIVFSNPSDRRAFTEDFVQAFESLIQKYHRPDASSGRRFRLLVGAYPSITPERHAHEKEDTTH